MVGGDIEERRSGGGRKKGRPERGGWWRREKEEEEGEASVTCKFWQSDHHLCRAGWSVVEFVEHNLLVCVKEVGAESGNGSGGAANVVPATQSVST